MGKHDDDDDDEKSAYVSNARSSGGGGKGSEPGDEDDMLNPVVKAFCHHVVSSKFRKELDTFFSFYCDDFEDADVDSEQRLEWTATFEKYVAKIEEMLETFCGVHQLVAEGVFTMVQRACASGMLDDEFLPSILSITDYRFFVEQMGLMAAEDSWHRRAQRLGGAGDGGEGKGGDDDNLSGVWLVATKDGKEQLTETKGGLDRYLSAVGVPKSLHGLFKGTLFSAKGLLVVHEEDSLVFISDTITGRHKQAFRADGKTRELSNMSGTKTPFSCSSDAYGRVTVRNEKPSGLPRGSAVVHTWQILGKHLKCTAEVERPGGVVMHEFYYRRSVPKKKRQPGSPKKKAHK